MKKVLILLLCFIFVFTSCKQTFGDSTDTDDTAIALTDTDGDSVRYLVDYDTYSLTKPDGGLNMMAYSVSSFFRDGLFYAESGNGFSVYDTDGVCVGTYSFSGYNRGLNTGMTLLCNGSFVVMESLNLPYLAVIDADGNILHETELPSSFVSGLRCIIRADENSIYVMQGNTLYRYATDLALLRTEFLPGEYGTGMHLLENGVLLLGDRVSNASVYEAENGSVTLYFDDAVLNTRGKDYVYADAAGNVYTANENEVCLTGKTGESETVFTWTSGSARFHPSMYILDGDTVFTYTAVGMENTQSYYCLIPYCALGEEHRRILTLGIHDIDNTGYVAALVDSFNQTNTSYYIETVLYDVEDYSDGYTALEEMFLRGEDIPDMLCLFNASYLKLNRTLADKDAFVDLAPHYADRLLGGLKHAYTVNGAMPFIPLGLNMNTLACSVTEIGETDSVTMDDVYALAQELEHGEALFSDPHTADDLYEIAMSDFIDYENGICNFDSDAFRSMIRFTEQAESEYTDSSLGYFNFYNTQGNVMTVSDLCLRQSLQTGVLKFLNMPLSSPMHYLSVKQIFGNTPFRMCGFPLNDGYGIKTTGAHFLCITEQSENKGGAGAFLDYTLSVQAQLSQKLTDAYFPVTAEAAETYLTKYYYYYEDAAEWDSYYVHDPISDTAVPSGVYVKPSLVTDKALTEAQMDAYRERGIAFTEYHISDAECAEIMDFLNHSTMSGGVSDDSMVTAILEEELSAYESGAKTLDEVSKLIQSRVSIYLAERQ